MPTARWCNYHSRDPQSPGPRTCVRKRKALYPETRRLAVLAILEAGENQGPPDMFLRRVCSGSQGVGVNRLPGLLPFSTSAFTRTK